MSSTGEANPRIQRFFCDHPASVGETYLEHLAQALIFGVRMIATGFACLVHAFVPEAFSSIPSNTVRDLHQKMTTRRRKPGQS